MQTILLFVHLVVCVGLIFLVLMQRSEGGALGVGGGGGGACLSSRGAANLIVRLTTIAGIIFFGTSITLSLLGGQASQERNRSVTDAPIASTVTPEVPLEPTRASPAAALAPGAVTVAPSPTAAAERAGPALLSPAPAAAATQPTSAPRPATTTPPRPAPSTTSSSRPAPAASEPAAEAPAPVAETPAPAQEPAPAPPRQRAGPDQ